ncbi:MAG TPA: thioredoxin [Chthoniobacterales bacterium]
MSKPIVIDSTNFPTEVLQSTQPVLVDFWATWCGPCKMIAPVLDEIATETQGKYKIAKVDVDQNPALADAFSIRSIPTLLIFKDGQVVDQIVGLSSKASLLGKLEKAA